MTAKTSQNMAFGFNATTVVVFLSMQILYVELVLAKTSTNSTTSKPTDKILQPATRITGPTGTSSKQRFNVDHLDDLNKNKYNDSSYSVRVRYGDTLTNTSNINEVQDHKRGQLQKRVKRFMETAQETKARVTRERNAHFKVQDLQREGEKKQDRQRKVRERMQKELNAVNAKAAKLYQKADDEEYAVGDADYAAKLKKKEAKIKREKERKAQLKREREREAKLRKEEQRLKKANAKAKQKKKKQRAKAKKQANKSKKKKKNKTTKIKAVGNKKTGTASKKKKKSSGSDSVSNCTLFLLLPSLLLTYILNS